MNAQAARFECVSVTRRGRNLVTDVSFTVGQGAIHALLGHNGAGKTTLLRALCGVVPVSAGRVLMPSEPAVLFAHERMPAEMTAAQLLDYRRRLRGLSRAQVIAAAERTGIQGFFHRKCATLSTGMAQRVNLAIAIMDDAATIVLDEPTTGLDPQGVAELLTLVVGLRAEGRTVMICSHDLSQLELVCDEVTCVQAGRVTATGGVAQVAATAPPSGQVLRTSDDPRARHLLDRAGIAATVTARGLRVGPEAGISQVISALKDLEVREATVERSLFARIYERYGCAPAPSRRSLHGAAT